MPKIDNNVSVIKKWLDQGGDLSKLFSKYDGTSFQELKEKVDLILENAPEDLDSFKELVDLLNDDKIKLEKILANKVDKEEGKRLLSNEDINKLFDGYYDLFDYDYDDIIQSGIYKIKNTNESFDLLLVWNDFDNDYIEQIKISTYTPIFHKRKYENSQWTEWKITFVSKDEFDKIKEIIYKDNNKTIVLSGDVTLLKGIDIKGYTELNENIVKYPLSIDSISVNGKNINSKSIEVDNLYSIDENTYDSLNCSFDKITNVQKVKHIYLPEEGIEGENNTDKKSWVYSSMQSTKDYNLFYINLHYSHIDGNEKPILSTKEYLDLYIYSFAKGYWKEGTTFKELKYTDITKTLEDRTFFFQADMPRLWFVSRQGEGYSNIKVDANNPNPQIPIELFFEKQMTEIDVTDKYSELWEYIKNNGAGQKVEIKDNYSRLLENEIRYGNLISDKSGDGSSEEIEVIKMALNNKANKENAFDYYIEINQDGIFEYDRYTNIGTYLLCQKTDEDYWNSPWQHYKLLTVADSDPNYLIQTEYDLSHGGCRTRDNYDEEAYMGGKWKPWVDVFASKNDITNKVDKIDGKGLISNELIFINKNIFNDDDLFDGIITKDFDPDMEEDLTGFVDGIYKVVDTKGNFIGIVQGSTSYVEGYDYSFYDEIFENLEGNVWVAYYEDGGGGGWSPYRGTSGIKLKDKLFENKVDKEKGKRLIADEINMIANNIFGDIDDLFDDVIISDFNPESDTGPIRGHDESGIFKVVDTKGNFIGILETEYSTDPSIHEDYYIVSESFEDLNGVVWSFDDEDGGGYNDTWEVNTSHKINLRDKIFITNKTVGDIETALDNIINIQNSLIGGEA